jgi:drug/metabolite transporter (DMT)-like permease
MKMKNNITPTTKSKPNPCLIFFLLILSQVAFALWDIISREVFDRNVHPFLPPLPFIALRTFLAASINVIFALLVEGTSPRKRINIKEIKEKMCNNENTGDSPSKTIERKRLITRKSSSPFFKPPSQLKLFIALNLLAFLGLTLSRILYQTGIQLTTSTHAAAMQPLIAPATTVLVLVIGLEHRDSYTNGSHIYRKFMDVLFVPLLALLGSMVVVLRGGHHEQSRNKSYSSVQNFKDSAPSLTIINMVESTFSWSAKMCGTLILIIQVAGFALFFVVQQNLLQWFKPIWLSALTFVVGAPQIGFLTYISMKFWENTPATSQASFVAAAAVPFLKNSARAAGRDYAVSAASAAIKVKGLNHIKAINTTIAAALTDDMNLSTVGFFSKTGPYSFQRLFFAMDNFPRATTTVIILSLIYCVLASVFYMSSQTWAGCYVDTSTVALFVCIHPLATALFSTILLGRNTTSWDIAGGTMILLAFFMEGKRILTAKTIKRRLKWRQLWVMGTWEREPSIIGEKKKDASLDYGRNRSYWESESSNNAHEVKFAVDKAWSNKGGQEYDIENGRKRKNYQEHTKVVRMDPKTADFFTNQHKN